MNHINSFRIPEIFRIVRSKRISIARPVWLLPLILFAFMYVQFALEYGWKFRSISELDLPAFHSASVSVFQHERSPYDPEVLKNMDGYSIQVPPFFYPPPSLLLLAPLSLMSIEEAHYAFLILNHILFLVLLWAVPLLVIRPGRDDMPYVLSLSLVYMMTFHPVEVTLYHGQVNIILLSFLTAFWVLGRKGHASAAGFFLALAIVLKTYPLFLIPMLLLVKRWKECAYTAAWTGAVVAVSALILPAQVWGDWLTNVFPSGGYSRTPAGLFSPAAVWNQTLNGFFSRVFTESPWSYGLFSSPELGRYAAYAASFAVTAVTALAVWKSRRHPESFHRAVFASLPAMYLIAPFAWEHHLVYLIPSVLIVLTMRPFGSIKGKIIYYSLAVMMAVLLALPGLLAVKFFGVVLLWGLGVHNLLYADKVHASVLKSSAPPIPAGT